MPKHPLLDVEDDDRRQDRIATLLERLNSASSSGSVPPFPDIGRERVPGPVKPPSDLLARIKAFLPAIAASNEALSQQKPEDINIENVSRDERRYIEMNLGLGVFDMKPRPKSGSRPTTPLSDAESESAPHKAESESESDSESSRSSSEEDSDYSSPGDDDSDVESRPESPVEMKLISSRPMKPLPRAKIEV